MSNLASLFALGACSLALRGRGGVGGGAPGARWGRYALLEAGAGASSRQPSHFLLSRQKKVTKEKATPLRASLRFATGNLRCSLFTGSAQTRFAQTRAALIREKLRSSARAEGTWNSTRHGASLCGMQVGVSSWSSLTPTLAHMHMHMLMLAHLRMFLFQASCSEAVGGRAQRWPVPYPLCACRGAELFADQGRACLSEASLRGPREKRAPQVARSEAEGHAQWGRLSLVTFFGETKKVTRPPGRTPGSGLNPSAPYKQNPKRPHPNPPPEAGAEEARQKAEGARPS
ncbi:hypothetical protein WDL1CHR_05682 [Variovorax sp. WDL1]|nr:hypothetical protein CHC06_07707 [Variovorax sp. B2]PNG47992.1 hypothetical protein CHC07_07161 [Variovorax sp. B4]VTV15255.1 hypothetical protein WDL1CHR_05682 [Variovorax sp. WDL1]